MYGAISCCPALTNALETMPFSQFWARMALFGGGVTVLLPVTFSHGMSVIFVVTFFTWYECYFCYFILSEMFLLFYF